MKSALFCLAAILLAGCSKNIDTSEAVKAGVLKDIAGKVDVGSMDVNVDSVSFREKEADAQVSFRPKGLPQGGAIIMQYVMERDGDEWKIKSRSMQGNHETDQNGVNPPTPGQTALPPGHPSVPPGTQASPLPPGHPTAPGQTPDSSKK